MCAVYMNITCACNHTLDHIASPKKWHLRCSRKHLHWGLNTGLRFQQHSQNMGGLFGNFGLN